MREFLKPLCCCRIIVGLKLVGKEPKFALLNHLFLPSNSGLCIILPYHISKYVFVAALTFSLMASFSMLPHFSPRRSFEIALI